MRGGVEVRWLAVWIGVALAGCQSADLPDDDADDDLGTEEVDLCERDVAAISEYLGLGEDSLRLTGIKGHLSSSSDAFGSDPCYAGGVLVLWSPGRCGVRVELRRASSGVLAAELVELYLDPDCELNHEGPYGSYFATDPAQTTLGITGEGAGFSCVAVDLSLVVRGTFQSEVDGSNFELPASELTVAGFFPVQSTGEVGRVRIEMWPQPVSALFERWLTDEWAHREMAIATALSGVEHGQDEG